MLDTIFKTFPVPVITIDSKTLYVIDVNTACTKSNKNIKKNTSIYTYIKKFNVSLYKEVASFYINDGSDSHVGCIVSVYNPIRSDHENSTIRWCILEFLDAPHIVSIKNRYLSTFIHELNVPIISMISVLQLINDTNLDNLSNSQLQWINTLHHNINDLVAFVNNIIDYIELEDKPTVTHSSNFLLEDIFTDVISMFQEQCSTKNISIKVDNTCPINLKIYTDYIKYKQVLLHVVLNAIKFNKANGSITIKLYLKDILGISNVCCDITDTGIGIDMQEVNSIFQSGYSLVSSRNPNPRHGIGLSLSKKIINLLGGDIHLVNSSIDVGSTFYLYIPVIYTNLKEQSALNIIKVLIVDDIPLSSMVLKFCLLKTSTSKVFDVNTTIIKQLTDDDQYINRNDYDIIFFDINDTNKQHVIDIVRSIKTTKKIFKIAIDDCTEYKFDYYISKPIVKSRLIDCIQNYFQFVSDTLV